MKNTTMSSGKLFSLLLKAVLPTISPLYLTYLPNTFIFSHKAEAAPQAVCSPAG